MKADCYYKFSNGNCFKVQLIKDNLCFCRTINRYDTFYMTVEDGDYKLFIGELEEIEAPKFDLTKGAQIRGGEIQDRTLF